MIAPQFTDTDVETITKIVERYLAQNTWKEDTVFEEESFLLLEHILIDGKELEKKVPYTDLVDTSFSKRAAK